MLDIFARSWWVTTLRGCLAVLFGATALVWPGVTVLALVGIFAAYALADGAATLGSALLGNRTRGRRGWLAAQGVVSLAAGVAALSWPGITVVALVWVIAARALAMGILDITTASRFRNELNKEWMLGISGALSVVLAALLVAWPARGALAIVSVVAIYALLAGAALIGLGFRLHRIHRAHPSAVARQPVTT